MQRDVQAEVILCPNCNEDVPKTLYCLNCGYPLYKVELEQAEPEMTEASEAEETIEQFEPEPIEADTAPDMPSLPEWAEEAAAESVIEADEEEELSVEEVEPVEHEPELVEEAAAEDVPIAEAIEAQAAEDIGEVAVTEDIAAEEGSYEIAEEIAVEEGERMELVEEQEEPPEDELMEEAETISAEFEPDPLIAMVMEQVARNISLKVRLVNLLIDDDVNESTFNRLFESYAARGERWINRRNEMLERNRYDLESMEKSLTEARMSLEELRIRRAIGDALEEEHDAKAPAFRWDIHQLERSLQQIRGENAYLGDLGRVMSAEEAQNLTEMADDCLGALDDQVESGKIDAKTAARVKATIEDALECLRGSGDE